MTRFAVVIAIAAGFLAAFLCVPAAAQNICAERGEMVNRLYEKWEEAQIGYGLVNDGRMIEIFVANSDDSSWTIIISDPSGKSCVASAGKNFTIFDDPKVPGSGT